MRSAVLGLAVLMLLAQTARAGGAREQTDALAAAGDKASRQAALDALLALDPMPVPELTELLARARTSSDADRRAVLKARGFDVPDEKGKFANPGRQTDEQEKANDKLDWMAPLMDQARSPALADVLVDLALIRALAASKSSAGADAILSFAFTADGVAYRDECGRFLRQLSPWSLPALIVGAETKQKTEAGKSRARYAKYQLERLDRENPKKALNDAPTDALKIEILKAFAESQYREAVYATLDTVDDVSPDVRAAARAAWMEYATGRPPIPAPKMKLQLPGGKLSEKEEPLWLDHRELADIAIRRLLEKLNGAAPDRKAKLVEMSEQLFAFYDQRRAKTLDTQLDAALEDGRGGKLAEAAAVFDRILVQAPDFARRPDMADIYVRYAEALEKEGKLREAAVAYGKAYAVAPEGPLAGKAEKGQLNARAGVLKKEGKEAEAAAMQQQASAIDGSVRGADGGGGGGGDKAWMLAVGIGAGACGLLLLIWGLAARRRQWR
ncbi:MAG TPA: hypothetical protein VMZ28_12320 [Kofleriaceae bacterium]|nr:hypothetical protein [Kofleriaceae bacterium]